MTWELILPGFYLPGAATTRQISILPVLMFGLDLAPTPGTDVILDAPIRVC